ncbi:MAG TPA: tRNA preQ1(34) S-adenosylmethionine ribosyltransferase-isomerase QueA [Candidatus Paceibacterota bacterium]|jgi:S-adenosylmethionine:tRNA ribosyltransferase-isomerase|nr:tRNA preQ1(34) S-adenosylmethionine ribosyltransferase-isomerase QueA [Bacteroidota bacterium]HRV32685.1 tRNA preQ1(34) S-adenosylmethionine ribosyltransferase-isomerase QueA [Candidatus Paceibacterota bacterium]
MKLSDFKYPLPRNLIAKYPVSPRDRSRLMVLHRDTQEIELKHFYEIVDYFEEGSCLVMNETKVFPARLIGRKEKTNAKIEVFILRELSKEENIWDVIVDPARKVRIGNKIYFDDDRFYCEVIDNTTSRGRTVRFNTKDDFFKIINKIGKMPLPHYIKREPTEKDKETYQTVYAKNIGSVAAPTAGLHFTKQLLKKIENKGVKLAYITLHVGLGTFRTVEVEDLTKHRMDSEFYEITPQTAEIINKCIAHKGKIIAVGTSTTRALESSVTTDNFVKPIKGWTDKFIFPPYNFRIVNQLITNFHLPSSTLLMLVAAFADRDFVMKAYKKAIKENFRFYSYGDAMYII